MWARRETGKKRIFVAVGISKPLQETILLWQVAHAKLPVRWLTGKNLHVTLIPPWYAEEIAEARELLRTIEGRPRPIDIEFTKVTFGPDPARPRLIWAEGFTPQPLIALKKMTEAALGQKPEARPFRLHLTLARFREEDFPAFPVRTLSETVAWRDTIHSFLLMESHLSRSGADYKILEEIML